MISPEEVLELAKLAHLKLDDSEIAIYQNDLQEILDYVNLLDEVDISSLETKSEINKSSTPLREDIIQSSLSVEEALKNAPAREGNYFKVPRVVKR